MNKQKTRFSKFTILSVVMLGMTAVFAADTTDYTKWIQMIQSDTNSAPESTSGYSHAGGSFWSDGQKPTTDSPYYVPAGFTLFSPNKGTGPFTFGGAKLAIAGQMDMRTGSGKHVNYRELRLLPGSVLRWKSTGLIGGDRGFIVAMGTDASPAVAYADFDYMSGSPVYCTMSNLTAAADGVIKFMTGNATNVHWWAFYGSLPEYQGRMILADPNAYYRTADFTEFPGTLVYTANGRPYLPEGFPGKVAAGGGYTLKVDNIATNKSSVAFAAEADGTLEFASSRSLKSLSMSTGSTVKLTCNSDKKTVKTLTIEEDLTVSEGAIIELDGLAIADCTGTPKVIKLMTLAADVTVPDVSGLKLKPIVGVVPHGIFSIQEGTDGTHELYVTWKPIVTLENIDNINNADFFTWADNGYRWSNGKIPEAGNDYLIMGKGGFTWGKPKGQVEFLGDSLTFYNQSIYLGTGNINASDFTVDGYSFTSYGNDRHWRGNLRVGPGGMSGSSYQGNTFFIDSTVSGTGEMKFYCRTAANTAVPYGSIELTGTNTAFGGSIWVNTPFSPANGTKPATPDVANDYLMKLYVTDGRNLGGPWQGDGTWNYRAICVDNFGRLIARNSVTFDEPTRGFFIDVCTRMEAPSGSTMAIKNPVTYAGELRWEGEGTLALGGPVRFMDGESTTLPEAGSNVLHIVKGALKPLSVDSFNGLQIVLDEAATLKQDFNPSDANVKQYGLYNLSSTAFVLPESKKIKVELEGDQPTAAGSVALFTVSKAFETEAGLSTGSVTLSSAKSCQLTVTRQENSDDQTVTYSAAFVPTPLRVLFF